MFGLPLAKIDTGQLLSSDSSLAESEPEDLHGHVQAVSRLPSSSELLICGFEFKSAEFLN